MVIFVIAPLQRASDGVVQDDSIFTDPTFVDDHSDNHNRSLGLDFISIFRQITTDVTLIFVSYFNFLNRNLENRMLPPSEN